MKKRGRPAMWKERGAVFSVHIPKWMYVEIRELARSRDMSVSAVTRAAYRSIINKKTDSVAS